MTPEEAVRHAIMAELRRLPPNYRAAFDGHVDEMVAAQMAGSPNDYLQSIRSLAEAGHPDFEPSSPVTPSRQTLFQASADRQLQDAMLKDYPGAAWTPSQLQGRTPEPYELSPGAKMKSDIEERQRLFGEMGRVSQGEMAGQSSDSQFFSVGPSAWMGVAPDKKIESQILADNYDRAINRTHAPGTDLVNQVNNPENWFGTFVTKMGPVLSDAGSLFGSALLDNNPTSGVSTAMGDAAVRSQAADWNRTSPVLAQDRGWRENDKLLREMRENYRKSEGMTAGDTVTAANGGRQLPFPLHQIASGAASFFNGLMDMSSAASGPGAALTKSAATQLGKTGIPLMGAYGRHIARTIGKDMASTGSKTVMGQIGKYTTREMGDEMFDVSNAANTAANVLSPPPPETPEQFRARMLTDSQARQQATRQLEANQGQVVRPRKNHGFLGNLTY